MTNPTITIAHKELIEHARDIRSLQSTGLYTLMGPAVVLLVSWSRGDSGAGLPVMASVFALVAAFTGSMSLAMDSIAGERERRSLLPLLLSSASRLEIIMGKWLAAAVLAVLGLILNVVAFLAVLAAGSGAGGVPDASALLAIAPALVALAMLAAAIELLVSTSCRSPKEAHTSLSVIVFAVMSAGMWLAFRPAAGAGLLSVVPIAGHQQLLMTGFGGGAASLSTAAALALTTFALTALAIAHAARQLHRDEVVYGC